MCIREVYTQGVYKEVYTQGVDKRSIPRVLIRGERHNEARSILSLPRVRHNEARSIPLSLGLQA